MPDEETYKPDTNTAYGLDVIRELATRHEGSLERLVRINGAVSVTTLLTAGPLTGEQLLREFEEIAKKRDIDTQKFLERLVGEVAWFTGTKEELTVINQILKASEQRKKPSQEECD